MTPDESILKLCAKAIAAKEQADVEESIEIALSKPTLDRGETVATNIIMPVTIAAFVNLTLISDRKFQNFARGRN
jgi:hypothetical protein